MIVKRGFDEFFSEHYERVARSIAVAAGDRELTEDVVQEAFARALRRWRTVQATDRPATWVYVVAMNLLRDKWRRRRDTAADDVDQEAEPVPDSAGAVVVVSVREAIRTLPARQRQAIALRYLGDLSIAETAHAMGCAVGTVKATLYRAHAALRLQLEEDIDES